MEELSSAQRQALPYSLLYDPTMGRAAAYTNNHRLVTELASQKLVTYALANTANVAPFDPVAHAQGLPDWRPLPAWATQEVQARLQLLWLQRPGPDDEEAWQAIPRR